MALTVEKGEAMARNPRKINPDMSTVGVSFDKGILKVLKAIAKKEDRSLASQLRRIVNSWLVSPEGRAAATGVRITLKDGESTAAIDALMVEFSGAEPTNLEVNTGSERSITVKQQAASIKCSIAVWWITTEDDS